MRQHTQSILNVKITPNACMNTSCPCLSLRFAKDDLERMTVM